MPKALHRKLKKQVKNKKWPTKKKNRYIYGTMSKLKSRKAIT